jgi:sulfite exporter TauE/SafE/copper chaperone CopZ/plastocyanin
MEHRIPITGMMCAACEDTVREAALSLPGVTAASASARNGVLTVTADTEPDRARLAAALRESPYRVGRAAWLSRDKKVWFEILAAVAIVAVAAFALNRTGLLERATSVSTLAASGSLLVIALIGVVASVSTCAAVVGSVAIGLGAAAGSNPQRWRVQGAFNVGRIVGFAVLGAVMGAMGSVLALSPVVIGIAMIASAAVMALVGLRLTGASPRVEGWGVRLPGRWTARVTSLAQGRAGLGRAALVGAATFILPCGFTQAVQIYAIGTANPATAAAVMAVFAIGTTPGLMAIGMASALRVRGVIARGVGVLALAFAGTIVVATLGPVLNPPVPLSTLAEPSENVALVDGVQQVRTAIVFEGYAPADTEVYAGYPVEWTFVPEGLSCAGMVDLDQFGVGLVDAVWETQTVRFTPPAPGVYKYECWMGMYSGTFTVIEPPAA